MTRILWAIILFHALFLGAEGILINNDDGAPGFSYTGNWSASDYAGYKGGSYLFTRGSVEYSAATWTPDIPEKGYYEVSAVFLASPNRTREANFTVTHAHGSELVTISQYGNAEQGQIREISLGTYPFTQGTEGSVTLSNNGGTGIYIADSIRFVRQENLTPSFAIPQLSPGFPGSEDSIEITVQIRPNENIREVLAHYSVQPAGILETVSASSADYGQYTATIPPQESKSEVRFYFTAIDDEDNIYTSDTVSFRIDDNEYRVIWAHSWGRSFLSPSQAEDLVQTCRDNNINTIIIQVRKVGDAYYDSSIEPRATNITGGADYDPLQYLIELAHDTSDGKPYVHIHAWFVMQRIDTEGVMMQKDPAHVLYNHPEYIMKDDSGNTAHSGSYYLDPGHPGSVEWNIDVILDCMEKYDVDGVNLDYIRYPGGRWGYNPASVQRFQAAFSRDDIPAYNDPDWSDWRRLLISNQIKKIYVKMWEKDPGVILTACTINWGEDYTHESFPQSGAYKSVFQDWPGWLREGIIDYNALMNYSPRNQPERYYGWTDFSLENDDIRGSIIGMGAYLQETIDESMKQLEYARNQGAAGLNIYAWNHEVDASTQGETRADFYEVLSSRLFTSWVDPPVSTWKDSPENGIIQGTVSYNGNPLDYCAVMINDTPETTVYSDGNGWYGLLEVPAGNHTLRFIKDGHPTRKADITITRGGEIISHNIDLKADLEQ